jgi:argininosuccinate lyase
VIYILDTTTTGSGLDLYFRAALLNGAVLVTDDLTRYGRDINRARLSEVRTISPEMFETCLKQESWPLGAPTLVISNSDARLMDAAVISRRLGLPAPAPETLALMMEKDRFRRLQRDRGVPCPRSDVLDADGSLPVGITFPVVCKPARGTGSLGVRLCRAPEDVALWLEEIRSSPVQASALLAEAYIEGPLFSVEALFDPSTGIHVLGHTDRELGSPPYFVETSYAFPVAPPAAVEAALLGDLETLTSDLDDSFVMHAEYVVSTATGLPVIIEINPRVGGGMLSRMVSQALGIECFDLFLAAWRQAPVPPAPSRLAGLCHSWKFAEESGSIASIAQADCVALDPRILEYRWSRAVGDRVAPSRDYRGELLSVLTQDVDALAARSLCMAVVQSSRVEIDRRT